MESEAQKVSLFQKIKDFFTGVRTEYSKIIFPTQEELRKQTIAVLISSFFIALLILAVDTVFKFGLGFIL